MISSERRSRSTNPQRIPSFVHPDAAADEENLGRIHITNQDEQLQETNPEVDMHSPFIVSKLSNNF